MKFVIDSPKYGKHTVVIDDEDAVKVMKYKWYIQTRRLKNNIVVMLAVVSVKRYAGKTKTTYLHRLLKKGRMIDHINGNVLDNRKMNLRICNYSTNRQNANPNYSAEHAYKGVRKLQTKNGVKYFAQIKINGKRVGHGNFETATEAAIAYNSLAQEHFGEFARLNKI